ncbi:UNVERIFIED_CONTAM: putative GMP synthase [glutamine-hydrolyzing] [Sesamum latifolium]|uniref:GMP synthase [glutamine-hydrolyzing] n=1 Tax=Sesamum latifolium TaxID=2727402 RepID=A0AAW2XCT8_9LAMI
MSGAAKIRSTNMADSEVRPILGPGGNKAQRSVDARKPVLKSLKKAEKSAEEAVPVEDKNGSLPASTRAESSPLLYYVSVPSSLRRHESLLCSNLSLSASCSSDASTDSFHSRASTGRICRRISKSSRKELASKARNGSVSNGVTESLTEGVQAKRRCAWVTASTDPIYVAFHDEEWGVPTHDDKKLFEFLVLSGALAELTWPAILSKRHIFREVFADFDPTAVAKLSEKKIIAPGSPASSLLSEPKLRSIIENARQVSRVIDEFGSFDKYIWSFVNYKPIVGSFRYPRQVPVKTPKADVISKDLVRQGFRSVGPTIIYSFMQGAGMTNDHLMSCFRFHECGTAEAKEGSPLTNKAEEEKAGSEAHRSIDELSFSFTMT